MCPWTGLWLLPDKSQGPHCQALSFACGMCALEADETLGSHCPGAGGWPEGRGSTSRVGTQVGGVTVAQLHFDTGRPEVTCDEHEC